MDVAAEYPRALCRFASPASVYAAWQSFESGMMLCFADTREIYVLLNEGQRVEVYPEHPLLNQRSYRPKTILFRFEVSAQYGNNWAARKMNLGGR